MRREITHTTRGNTLGEMQDLIDSLVARVGRGAKISDIESDIDRSWIEAPWGAEQQEWFEGTIGIRVVEGE